MNISGSHYTTQSMHVHYGQNTTNTLPTIQRIEQTLIQIDLTKVNNIIQNKIGLFRITILCT